MAYFLANVAELLCFCVVWLLQKTAPGTCAEFLGTVNVTGSQARGKLTEVGSNYSQCIMPRIHFIE